MVYNTQNYWVFGLRPTSGVLETRKHTETDPVSETLCFLVSRIPVIPSNSDYIPSLHT
jgi:hypothetical protein